MNITIEAIYEVGVLRPLGLQQHPGDHECGLDFRQTTFVIAGGKQAGLGE